MSQKEKLYNVGPCAYCKKRLPKFGSLHMSHSINGKPVSVIPAYIHEERNGLTIQTDRFIEDVIKSLCSDAVCHTEFHLAASFL